MAFTKEGTVHGGARNQGSMLNFVYACGMGEGGERTQTKQKEMKTETKMKTHLTTMARCQKDTGAELLTAKPFKQQNKVVLDYDSSRK